MTTTAIAEREAPHVTGEQLDLIKRTVASGATDSELRLYLFDCQRRGIHPLDKLLHFTKRGGKYTPVTSIDFMRSQAAMSGEMAGSDDPVFTEKPSPTGVGHMDLESATVTVYRLTSGQRFAYTATARWSEYCPDNAPMWKRMPHTMLGKCAEALALRKAFPQQLAGLYSREEMDHADAAPQTAAKPSYAVEAPATVVDVTRGVEVPASEGPTPPDGFAYLDACDVQNGWCNVVWKGETYKTKLETVIGIAQHAFQSGVPVRVISRKAPWLDRVEQWAPQPDPDADLCAGCGKPFLACNCDVPL